MIPHFDRWSLVQRYGLACFSVSLTLLLTYGIRALYSQGSLFLLLGAVMVSAWYGGRGPGLAALVLSAAGVTYFVFPPPFSFYTKETVDSIRLLLFIAASLVVILLTESRERALELLAEKNEFLEREVTERKRAQEQLQDLTERLNSVREEERTHVAREIHDVLGQMLLVLKMDLTWLRKRLPREEDGLRQRTDAMAGQIDELVQVVQRVTADLRPDLLDNLGIAAAVEWEVREFTKRSRIKTMVDVANVDKDVVDGERATTMFRILQEALTNVARHAKASEVDVILKKEAGWLTLTVEDNGKGIRNDELTSPRSLGLLGMKERVRPFGGQVIITGKPRQGTTVLATIPTGSPADRPDSRT